MRFPMLSGNVTISREGDAVVISGDPDGLRTFGRLLTWLADADQNEWPYLPEGGRAHVHLYPKTDLSPSSEPVELTRLDAKGTGAFPPDFTPK